MKKQSAVKTASFLCALFLIFTNAFAQSESVRSLSKIEGGFGGFGFGYEAKLGSKFTLDIGAGLSGRYEIYDNTFQYIFVNAYSVLPAVYISVNPRYYYNIARRVAKGKNIENNSANYIGAKIKIVPHLELPDPGALANVHWGLQRSFGKNKKWLFNTHLGAGYAGNIGKGGNEGMIYPAIDARFSYILSKNK